MKQLLPFLFLAFALQACNKENKIRVTDTSFSEIVETNSLIGFTFSEPLVPDSLVGLWLSDNLVEFTPAIEGSFKWTSREELVFIPRTNLAPSTQYEVKLSRQILQYKKGASFSGETEFSFQTPLLSLTQARAYWDAPAESGGKALLKFILQFNHEVDPNHLKDLLEIEIEGNSTTFILEQTSAAREISFTLPEIKAEDKDLDALVIISKGMLPVGGSLKTTRDIEESIAVLSPFKLNILDFQTGHDGSVGTIMVYTTQAVKSENFKSFIQISPELKYSYEIFPDYFLIKSESFNVESQYTLLVKKGLSGRIGGEIKHDYEQSISFGNVEPTLRFNDSQDFYVSVKGNRNMEVAIINIPVVQLKVTKIYENNILAYLRASENNYYNDYYDEYYYEDYYYYNSGVDAEQLGDVILEKEIETTSLPRRGINKLLTLDFADQLADFPGVYLIEVKDKENYWRKTTKLVSISDIGIIVKEGVNSISVFANSIKSTEPLAEVELTFIGLNNQVTFKGKTDKEGVLVYSFDKALTPNFHTKLITARLSKDYNVIPFNQTQVNTSRFDVGGLYQNQSGIQAYLYAERNLYRPGETIHLSGILRDYQWKSPGSLPLKIKISSPTGKTFKLIKKSLNEYGSFETDVPVPANASTGSYAIEVFTSHDVLIGSEVIKVEEFMPDRIKVKSELDRKEVKPAEKLDLLIEALNLFGPPAANRNYEVEVSTSRIGFYSKQHPSYNYTLEGSQQEFSSFNRSGLTDANGRARENFDIPDHWKHIGMLNSNVFVTVFDETGRPVNRLTSFKVITQDIFYGVKSENYYAATGQPVRFDLIAVDKEGIAKSGVKARMKLIRHEYKTVLSSTGSYYRYRSEPVEVVVEEKTITLNETNASFSFVPELSGQYELRISAPDASTYISQSIYAYGWGSTSYSSFKVNKEGNIDIELDKESYQTGDKAKVLLKTPFAGKVLVTVETNKVLEHFYLETDARAASFELEIKEHFVPNVYITASLIKPHGKSDMPLTVAHGFAPVKVEKASNKMKIAITAAEKSRSNSKQLIKIKASPNAAITVAVVDEGILQVGGYDSPNPYEFFYQKRALEVNSYSIYPYLFPELEGIRSATGGGDGEMDARRLNPLQNNRVQLVSFWSGILYTNSRGETQFEVSIPEFSGSLRVMAVGYKQHEVFGSAEASMLVADPLVQSAALPRFLSPGDKIEVPVILTNTTDKQARCKTTIEVSGPVIIEGERSQSVTIAPRAEDQVVFKLLANQEIGEAKVVIRTSALGEEFVQTTLIPVRPSSPLQKRNGSGQLAAGKSQTIELDATLYLPQSVDLKLVVSNNPLVQFSSSLEYLVGYPHGCVEQTISKAFPQIYYADMVKLLKSNTKASNDALQNVQAALDKLRLMQLYNGALTYWPGSGTETWWGSVYGAHFALEARKAGYEVDEEFLNGLLKYLKEKLKEKSFVTYYFNFNQKKEIAPKEVAYSLYVLSLAGEKPTALLNYYKANAHQLSLDSKYLLAGAYALTGDKQKFKEVLPLAFEGEKANRTFGGSFNSYLRDEAIALNVMLETDPENQQIGILSQHVSKALLSNPYLNTQERTFAFLAMGKVARLASKSEVSGTVKGNGTTLANYSNNSVTLNTSQLKGKKVSIENTGKGPVYYFWESQGITQDGSYKEEDSYLAIRKTLYNRNGQALNNLSFVQNELVLVELALRSLNNSIVENVAITDMLPAGFEIENPRLTSLPPGMSYPNYQSFADYMDVRDDRISLFVNAETSTRYYYYLVRCVSPGVFVMGPAAADAMYDGEYHSYHGGGEVIVERK